MGLRVKTNVPSLVAQRRLGENRNHMIDSLEKLSSGQRINKSADDAAGLAVSERIRARVRSLDVSKRNANDGISYIQVAEGGLNEVTNIVIRMRELAHQSASDTLSNRERTFLNKEFQQLRQEVRRVVETAEFNGQKVLVSEEQKPIQIFVGSSDRGSDIEGNPPDIDPATDPDILTINLDDLANLTESINAATDDSLSILTDGDSGSAAELGPEGTNALFNVLDTAVNAVASFRATLGSVQSRLNSTINNIDISSENLLAAQSRIRDVDYASETAKFTQARILSQAGLSTLAHANAQPEAVLSLLRS